MLRAESALLRVEDVLYIVEGGENADVEGGGSTDLSLDKPQMLRWTSTNVEGEESALLRV